MSRLFLINIFICRLVLFRMWTIICPAFSLEESVQMAVESHPDVLSAHQGVVISKQQEVKSRAGWLPTVNMEQWHRL